MSREKQIEEMAKGLHRNRCGGCGEELCEYKIPTNDEFSCIDYKMATALYNYWHNGKRGQGMKYIKYRFKTKAVEDYRPLIDMSDIKCPWWCSGESVYYVVIVCYLPQGEDLFKYWDDAYDIETEEVESINYTGRFPKPKWLESEDTE